MNDIEHDHEERRCEDCDAWQDRYEMLCQGWYWLCERCGVARERVAETYRELDAWVEAGR